MAVSSTPLDGRVDGRDRADQPHVSDRTLRSCDVRSQALVPQRLGGNAVHVTTAGGRPSSSSERPPVSKAAGSPATGGLPSAPASRGAQVSSAPAPKRGGAATPHRARGAGLTLAAALLVFVTVILVLFVVFNTQTVDISLVFADVEAPLVLALVIASALGGLVVALAGVATRGRRSKS